MSQRFRRLTDLFVDGKVVPLPSGDQLWVQVINAFERDECISDAQVARSRLVLALRESGDERAKVEARLLERGREAMARELAQSKSEAKIHDLMAEIQDDPDWKERMEILARTDFDNAAKPPTEEEQQLVAKINAEFFTELHERTTAEKDFLFNQFERMSDSDLLDEYIEAWLEKRGAELATAEYALTEMWFATRYCEATKNDDGTYDHSRCNGHPERVFVSKADARMAPTRLQELLANAIRDLTMVMRDPKDSDSQPSSSDSSPTLSEQGA